LRWGRGILIAGPLGICGMGAVWALVVVLVIVLAAVGAAAVRAYEYCEEFACMRFPRASMVDSPPAAGDVLLFVCHAHMFFNSVITRDVYTHAGMVAEDPDTGELWLSESAIGAMYPAAHGREIMGPRRATLTPLHYRMQQYPGTLVLLRLTPALTPELKDRLWNLALETAKYPQVHYMALQLVGAERMLFAQPRRHCMGHVAWLIDELGLRPAADAVPLQGRGPVGVCAAVTAVHERGASESGHTYAPPVEILYDVDLVP